MSLYSNPRSYPIAEHNQSLNKNFTYSLQTIQKQNNPILSNYSSYNPSNIPKQFLQKTIQMKNQHINELMQQLNQAKSSYEEFKQKISQENTKLKEQNASFKNKIEPLGKEREYLKKCIIKLEQQKTLFTQNLHNLNQQNSKTISQLNKRISQLQDQNKRFQKSLNLQQKSFTQLKLQKEETQNKFINLQNQVQLLRSQHNDEIKFMKETQLKLTQQNSQLKEALETYQEKKKTSKKYDKKLSRLQQKIANIIDKF